MQHKSIVLLTTCLVFILSSSFTMAKNQRQHKGPPPEAFKVCEGKSLGDAVTINTPRGDEMQASCQNSPDDKSVLVAVPKDREKPEDHN